MLKSLKYSALALGLIGATQAMAGPDLTVVSFGGANKAAQVKAFYSQVGIRHLRIFQDPTASAGFNLGTAGVPTTLLIDRQGRELGRLTGAAEWDSEDAIKLVRRTISP